MFLLKAGELELDDDLSGPFQPKTFQKSILLSMFLKEQRIFFNSKFEFKYIINDNMILQKFIACQ